MDIFNMVKIKDFFRKNHLPFRYLENFFEKSIESKDKLNKILGLTKENNYRIMIETEIEEDNFINLHNKMYNSIVFELSNIYKNVLHVSFTKNIFSYKDESGKTINTKLSKVLSCNLHNIFYKLDLTDFNNFLGYCIDKRNFVTRLFSLTKKVILFISTNPLDFILSSNPNWGNCYNIKGCHFNGNISLALDDFTLISYIIKNPNITNDIDLDPTKLMGRVWIYVFPDIGVVLHTKNYGSFSSLYKKYIRLYIEKKINEYLNIKSAWKAIELKNYTNVNYARNNASPSSIRPAPVYFDGISNKVTFCYNLKLHKGKENYYDILPSISFKMATCLSCGKETNNQSKGSCADCSANYICVECGSSKSEAIKLLLDRGYSAYYLCLDCRKNIEGETFYKCGSCSSYQLKPKIEELNYINGKVLKKYKENCNINNDSKILICTSCLLKIKNEFGNKLFKCKKCGIFTLSEDNEIKTLSEEIDVCNDCKKGNNNENI